LSIAHAHDYWANGTKVPDWVKSSCCGQADAHALDPSQVQHKDGFWYVDGYPDPIPDARVLPSQDGHYWIFYATTSGPVYCFFVPMEF